MRGTKKDGKKEVKLLLFAAIAWLVSAGIWLAHLCIDFYYGVSPEGLIVMHGICVFASLIAAAVNYVRYRSRKTKQNDQED